MNGAWRATILVADGGSVLAVMWVVLVSAALIYFKSRRNREFVRLINNGDVPALRDHIRRRCLIGLVVGLIIFVFLAGSGHTTAAWIVLVLAVINLIFVIHPDAFARAEPQHRCAKCGHASYGDTEPRCPECGEAI